MDLADRVVGSALGLALGDALGAPFEFLRARNIPDPIPALERPWLSEPPGSTTDDTAMARNPSRYGRYVPAATQISSSVVTTSIISP